MSAARRGVAVAAASVATVSAIVAPGVASARLQAEAPMVGDWTLDRGRTHYGTGVDRRRWERFACGMRGAALECRIEGEREGGGRVAARFSVVPGGAPAPVAGFPGIDAVRVRTVAATIADATFLARGSPAFGYRAYRTDDGRTLTVVAVDPVTRAALTTVVVYKRR